MWSISVCRIVGGAGFMIEVDYQWECFLMGWVNVLGIGVVLGVGVR